MSGLARAAALALALALALLALPGCSSHDERSDAPAPPPVDAAAAPPIATDPLVDGGATAAAGAAGPTDLDGGVIPEKPGKQRSRRLAGADRPVLVLTLRSTPTGATASVDGVAVGRTPTFWETEFDGREHVFTFAKDDYATQRRVFVPTTSGHVHATLVQISVVAADAGAAAADD